jgi:excisionase family DNA binding protein
MVAHTSQEASQVRVTALPLLGPREVSRLLGVSLATVKRLTGAGELPHVRVSRRRPRYRPEDVRWFIEAHRVAQKGADNANADAPAGTEASVATDAGAGGEGALPG